MSSHKFFLAIVVLMPATICCMEFEVKPVSRRLQETVILEKLDFSDTDIQFLNKDADNDRVTKYTALLNNGDFISVFKNKSGEMGCSRSAFIWEPGLKEEIIISLRLDKNNFHRLASLYKRQKQYEKGSTSV